jgi:hypothetical protein
MNAPSAYFGGRASMGSDSRRSLIRVRQQSEEKKTSLPIKQVYRLIFFRNFDPIFLLILAS